MMNLALNQFRKDVRQFRWLLLALTGFLLMDLASCQGWIDRPNWEWPFDAGLLRRGLVLWIFLLAGLSLVLAVGCVHGNSNFRENAFLRTRPCPGRAIWLGNLMFIGLFVIAPLILIETVNLALHGLPASIVRQGTWERATMVVPIVAIVIAMMVTPRDGRVIGVLIIATYGIGLAGAGLLGAASALFPETVGLGGVTPASTRFGLAVCAVLMAFRCAWLLRARPGATARWLVFILVIFTSEAAVFLGPQGAPVGGLAQTEVTDKLGRAQIELPLNSISASSGGIKGGVARLGWHPMPVVAGKPRDWFVHWGTCSATLETADGVVHRTGPNPGRTRIFDRESRYSIEELDGIARHLPEGTLLDDRDGFERRRAMSFRSFDLPAQADWWWQAAKLTVRGEGLAYRWAMAAELPVTKGAQAAAGLSKWEVMGAENKIDGQFEIVIEQQGPGLALSDRQDFLQTRRWPSDRYHFVLLDPEARVACTPDNRYINGGVVGAHAGHQRRTGILHFMERDFRQIGWRKHPEKLRLLVLRKDFLGSFEKTVHAKVVPGTFRDMFRRQEPVQTERLTAEDFQRRLAELAEPAPGANRAEVGNYVYALLQLAEAYPRITDTDPLVRRLAKLAPEHMELLCDGIDIAGSSASRALERALVRGVRPEQKEILIARLKQQPWLADVVVERGWFEDAREAMLALVDRDQNLPYDLLRALAWFEDPRADDRLMAELRGSRSGRVYGLVAALPRLRARLNEAIDEIWRDRPLTFRSSGSLDGSVEVAARHGITEAVDFIVRVTRQRHPDRGASDHMIMQLMGELVELPGITQRNRYDYDRIAAAIRALPEDVKFEFDAVLGKYRLTTGGAE